MADHTEPGCARSDAGVSTLTWTNLLTHWTALAQTSLVLPETAEGDRWRAAIPAIVGLQAITHALADLQTLASPEERRVGQDKAEMLIARHARTLYELWKGGNLPGEMEELVTDARRALETTRSAGVEWLALRGEDAPTTELDHPAELVEQLLALGFNGDLYLATPGVSIMPGAPIAFARARGGGEPSRPIQSAVGAFLAIPHKPGARVSFRQVYRQFDFGAGVVRRDLVVAEDRLVPGQPLLVPVILNGKPVAVTLPPPPGAVDRLREVPVEHEEA